MHPPFRPASGTVGAEFFRTQSVQDRLRHDRARRVAGAQKQHVERTFGHDTPQADAIGARTDGTQHALACATRASRSPVPSPYVVLSPVVKKVSHEMPAGSSIQDFSDFA